MRTFEIFLAVLALLTVVTPRSWMGARTSVGLALLPVGVIHATVEGWRWQMVPLYLIGGILVVVAAWELLSPAPFAYEPAQWLRGIGLLGLALVVALPAVIPVWELPDPGGRFGIGTIDLVVGDPDRPDPYDPEGGPRRLNLQIWYPAELADQNDPEPWLPNGDIVGPAIAEAFGFPSFALGHSNLIKSHSYRQAAVAGSGSFPVVVYSHGWTGLRSNGLDQVEALAAAGFIVVAPDHTYGSAATAFPDGELVPYEPTALPEFETVPAEVYDEAALLLVATFAADLLLILDELERLNVDAGWLLAGRLDLERIGLFGHSTGGGAAVAACAVDERCDAVVGLDPWVEPVAGEVLDAGIETPFLAIRSEEWLGYDNDPVLREFVRKSPQTDLLGLIGGGHQDFTVLPRFSVLGALLDTKGTISSDRASEIVNSYLVRFFDGHLKGGPGLSAVPVFEEICVGTCDVATG